jgi:hypothetical protein
MTVGYGDDDVWPVAGALEAPRRAVAPLDDTYVWTLKGEDNGQLSVVARPATAPSTSTVRRPSVPSSASARRIDLDVEVEGVVSPLTELQDQVNITSFGLQVAQHYGAFRQRYIWGGWPTPRPRRSRRAPAAS